jgi:hypothetical protein
MTEETPASTLSRLEARGQTHGSDPIVAKL